MGYQNGTIDGKLIPEVEYDMNGNPCGYINDTINLYTSLVKVDSLRNWLRARGLTTGFFFPSELPNPNYLNKEHPRYAPKLAAAINAWIALDNKDAIKGKSAKQALMKWLREHAKEYNLSDQEGKPNETGIEECAKVANWQEKGGAPKSL